MFSKLNSIQVPKLGTRMTSLLLVLFLAASMSFAHAKKGRKGKPPEEAFTACADQTNEAACSFQTTDGKTIEGQCAASRKDESLMVCKPDRGSKRKRNQ